LLRIATSDRTSVSADAGNFYLTRSGLWGITIPKAFGGAGVLHSTLVEVIAILAAADPSLGQIPHNHFCVIDAIRLDGTEHQKRFYFEQVLAGKRFGNAFSEAGTKNVMDFQTRITPDGDAFRVNGKKFYSTGALFAHIIPTAALKEEKKGQLAIIILTTSIHRAIRGIKV
jgi:alkylation response protein AidB-like acyl-CoA dehydrogenase